MKDDGYLELCTEEQLEDFYAEFDATKETIHRDVQYLIDWLQKQPHLPFITDERWLANFLLRCKNSVEKTKKRLDSYFSAKALYPEIFQNRDLSKLVPELSMFAFFPMPKLTPQGCRVLLCNISEHKPSDLPSGETIIKGMQLVFDHSLLVDRVRALTLIYDCQNVSMAFVSTILQAINRFLLVQNKINPLRYDKIYLLNLPSFGLPLVNMTCSLIKKETEKFVIWRKNASELSEVIPPECLPREYGGTERSLEELNDLYRRYFIGFQKQFTELDKMIPDLSKKPGKTEDVSVHGINGTFRRLNVD